MTVREVVDRTTIHCNAAMISEGLVLVDNCLFMDEVRGWGFSACVILQNQIEIFEATNMLHLPPHGSSSFHSFPLRYQHEETASTLPL